MWGMNGVSRLQILAADINTLTSLRGRQVRTLKVQLQPAQDVQGGSGVKRRLYLLLLVSAAQPIMMYWLTTHLVHFPAPLPPIPDSVLNGAGNAMG